MREQLYWRGTPVPYVALWSSETYSHVAFDPNAGGHAALFTAGARGEGEPVWGKMHEPRQRETVAKFRCQVCNCKLKDERAFAMDVPQAMLYEDREIPLLMEPPACMKCIRIALAMCPGNRRRAEAGVLKCYEVMAYKAIGQILQKVEVGGTPALNRILKTGQRVIGMNKCALTMYREMTLEQLKTEVG